MLLIHTYTDISTKKVTKVQKCFCSQTKIHMICCKLGEIYEKDVKIKFYKNTKQKIKCMDYYWVIIQLKN